ncbi:tRNA (adenosine(37)-N6)-dimethylallyltransferase MiaA [Lapillicoccus sp.]|uniref:tRNA (adenosine(37)-N6)-dimethylallyltransferase MiaA n=1 Tax=Lapillicoccus sp. TaxID=1909287 RepID=UPI0025EC572F|nr:tRNA (adenosine(37)-N6)-dimethylallyltransferase MiaA [Lapillicoccus sp.]
MTSQGGAGGGADAIVAVVGPTATGKSDLGLALAERLGGEVVNADAMQLYRGMDIGTAKLPVTERRGVPHHQLDVLDVRDEASVAAYQQAARADLDAIGHRGHRPLLVGGSGLYVRAALDRLEIPPTDAAVRARLMDELDSEGLPALRDRLQRCDPAAAATIEPSNGRRIVRALEVVELTGRPFSATMPRREHLAPTIVIGLRADRPVLDERIGLRVARMWSDGLVDEVERLLAVGLRDGPTASRALGYRQAIARLDGHLTAAQAMAETATATRRFARRQESWFRPDARVVWLPHDAPDLLDRALDLVAAGPLPPATLVP